MYTHVDWFVELYPYSGGMVYTGDDYLLEILGRQDIKIKLDDGRERKLCDV